MAKIFLDVQVPGSAKTYEFSVDSNMSVGRVKGDFIKQIALVEGREIFNDLSQVLFCSKNLGGLLSNEEILSSVDVKSGDTIILI